MADVHIYGFETSNNLKVRVALGYKSIPYTFHTIDSANRAEILRLSGQVLTPVMVHGNVVLFDSSAILRYLDANFRDTPSLFGHDRATQWEIEEWERFARGPMAAGMMSIVHQRVAGKPVGEDLVQRAAADFAESLGKIEIRLGERQWLVGEAMTAADVTAGCVVARIQRSGILPMPEGLDRVQAWVGRVMAHDRGAGA